MRRVAGARRRPPLSLPWSRRPRVEALVGEHLDGGRLSPATRLDQARAAADRTHEAVAELVEHLLGGRCPRPVGMLLFGCGHEDLLVVALAPEELRGLLPWR